MDEPPSDVSAPPALPSTPRRRLRLALGVAGAVAALALALAWSERTTIADRIILGELDHYRLPGTYRIESVGPLRQVLSHVVIGDPAHPDLTIERVEIVLSPTFGLPTVGRVTLVRPRLHGRYADGRISFGRLDPLLARRPGAAPGLPDLRLEIADGSALIDGDAGVLAIRAAGRGNLKSGFTGAIAAAAPRLTLGSCTAGQALAYGQVTTRAGVPRFHGPVRADALDCGGAALRGAVLALDAAADAELSRLSGTASLAAGAARAGGQHAARLAGSSRFTLAAGDLTASYQLDAAGIGGALAARSARIEGLARSHGQLARIDAEGTVTALELRPGPAIAARLARAEAGAQGTLAAPLLARARQALAREAPGSRLLATYALRRTGDLASLVIPRASLRGGSGTELVSLSRMQLAQGERAGLHLSGNVATGGADLPRLDGRIERQPGGTLLARLRLPEYRAQDASIAVPQLALVQSPRGQLGFAGTAVLSGALPGGHARGLVVPIDGNWSAARGLALGRRCTALRFDELTLGTLALDRRSVTVCPGPGGAILRSDGGGTRIAAGAPALDLAGRLGGAPIRLHSGPIGFAVPGALVARQIDAALGPADRPSTFRIANLTAQVGREIAGRFTDTEVRLDAVPLDILAAEGDWRYAGGALDITGARFRLEDRLRDDRFHPVIARDAVLALKDGQVTAAATLREMTSDRELTRVTVVHDLAAARGHADLAVPGIRFDKALQPVTLSTLALGVIANAEGTVSGSGRIDWNPRSITSTGSFSTEKLDFAAAFGPVDGLSGTVRFTDLLGLVTAPDQRLKLATINPGIAVDNGEVSFALQPGHVLVINGAQWPFVDGSLQLLPTRMVLGAAEVRRYTLRVTGVNAAKFIERLELGNVAATGTFDGDLPLVFDQDGGWIRGGLLVSRPPGGNVSYIGQLTYKDLSAMGNFAFQTLKSLDFRHMEIGMDGALDGEIVTRLRIQGVRQGDGAKRNMITRRLASLPIQFNINIRAPFQKLITSFKSMYDRSYLRDPRSLGLIGADGKPLAQPETPQTPIQPPESRKGP